MSDLKINALSVDLLQSQATLSLFKQMPPESGKSLFANVNVIVPIPNFVMAGTPQMRQIATESAIKLLEEAVVALREQQN